MYNLCRAFTRFHVIVVLVGVSVLTEEDAATVIDTAAARVPRTARAVVVNVGELGIIKPN